MDVTGSFRSSSFPAASQKGNDPNSFQVQSPRMIGGVDGQLYNKSNLTIASGNRVLNQSDGKEVQVFYYQPVKKKSTFLGSIFGSISPRGNGSKTGPSFADKLDATIANTPAADSSGPSTSTASAYQSSKTQSRDLSALARIGWQFSQVG
jgi:hypothetical protein